MSFLPKEIEDYCLSKSSKSSPLTEELYRYTEGHVERPMMLIGPHVAHVLGLLIRSIGAVRILEVGTFTGYSALVMAEHLPNHGELITLDINPDTVKVGESFWRRSPAGAKIKSIIGPAMDSLERLQGPFDFVLIDADKQNYPKYFDRCLSMLSKNGMIVLDNCLWSGNVLDQNIQDDDTRALREITNKISSRADLYTSFLPIRDGLLIVQKRHI